MLTGGVKSIFPCVLYILPTRSYPTPGFIFSADRYLELLTNVGNRINIRYSQKSIPKLKWMKTTTNKWEISQTERQRSLRHRESKHLTWYCFPHGAGFLTNITALECTFLLLLFHLTATAWNSNPHYCSPTLFTIIHVNKVGWAQKDWNSQTLLYKVVEVKSAGWAFPINSDCCLLIHSRCLGIALSSASQRKTKPWFLKFPGVLLVYY